MNIIPPIGCLFDSGPCGIGLPELRRAKLDNKLIRTGAITENFRHFFFYGGPVIAYAMLIYFLSSLSTFPEEIPSFFGFDKITHFLEYYFFGCLLYRWFSSMKRYRKRRSTLLMTIVIGTIYALSDEWHQSFVPGRDASFWDALFDAAGIGTGAATYDLVRQGLFPPREK
jgi:VanZ family protein